MGRRQTFDSFEQSGATAVAADQPQTAEDPAAGAEPGASDTQSPAEPSAADQAAKTSEPPAPTAGWKVATAFVARDSAPPYATPERANSAVSVTFETTTPPPHESAREPQLLDAIRESIQSQLGRLKELHAVVATAEAELAKLADLESDIATRRKAILEAAGPEMATKLEEINRELSDVAAKRSAHESTRAAILTARFEAFSAFTQEAGAAAGAAVTKMRKAVIEELAVAAQKLADAAGEALNGWLKLERKRHESFGTDNRIVGRLLQTVLSSEGLPPAIENPNPPVAPVKNHADAYANTGGLQFTPGGYG